MCVLFNCLPCFPGGYKLETQCNGHSGDVRIVFVVYRTLPQRVPHWTLTHSRQALSLLHLFYRGRDHVLQRVYTSTPLTPATYSTSYASYCPISQFSEGITQLHSGTAAQHLALACSPASCPAVSLTTQMEDLLPLLETYVLSSLE